MGGNVTQKLRQIDAIDILRSFSRPSTPKSVEKRLGIGKLKLRPFLDKQLLELLNETAHKGRLYQLTPKARRLLRIPAPVAKGKTDWDLTGWILASPKQRLPVLQAIDAAKRPSEAIRGRALKSNAHLTRVSVITVLKELVGKGLAHTEKNTTTRCYWLSESGKHILDRIADLSGPD